MFTSPLISQCKPTEQTQDENARAVVFFLHHAASQRLQFEINGHDTP